MKVSCVKYHFGRELLYRYVVTSPFSSALALQEKICPNQTLCARKITTDTLKSNFLVEEKFVNVIVIR